MIYSNIYTIPREQNTANYDEQNVNELLVGFKGETLREENW